jgi:aminoglycoside phosphotransferase (APT) family kinase protein
LLLENLGLELAPKALLLERERYAQPVLVQTWLEGSVMPAPVRADDWGALLNHYAALHRVTPDQGTLPLALHTASSLEEGKVLVQGHLGRLPRAAYPPGMAPLIETFKAWGVPAWPQPPLSLCRVDPNPSNFLRTDRGLRSVDWENSGWGDPAFELADLLTHPAYAAVSEEEVAGIAERYAARCSDDALHVRLEAYLGIGLMYWVVRFARMLYEVPRGLDPRLVGRPATWEGDTRRKYEAYVQRAQAFFRGV